MTSHQNLHLGGTNFDGEDSADDYMLDSVPGMVDMVRKNPDRSGSGAASYVVDVNEYLDPSPPPSPPAPLASVPSAPRKIGARVPAGPSTATSTSIDPPSTAGRMQDLIKDHANAIFEFSFCPNPKAKTAKALEKKVAEAEAAALAHHVEATRRSASCQCDNLGKELAEAKRVNLEQAKKLREADRKISGLEYSVKVKIEQLANMSKISVEAQAEARDLKRKAESVERHWGDRKSEVKAAIAANGKPRPPKKTSPKKT